MEVARTIGLEVGAPKTELVAELVAGPETAARLGVPVGTVVEARYAASSEDGESVGAVISVEEAQIIKNQFQEEDS